MSDLGVRTAARKEAELVEDEIYFAHRVVTRSGAGLAIRYFVEGAVWAAGRLPTRDEIAEALRGHNFDELILGNIEWDGYTAVCSCGWHSEESKMPGDAHQAHAAHAADAVLALIQSRLTT